MYMHEISQNTPPKNHIRQNLLARLLRGEEEVRSGTTPTDTHGHSVMSKITLPSFPMGMAWAASAFMTMTSFSGIVAYN